MGQLAIPMTTFVEYEKNTQKADILNFIREMGSITRMQAFTAIGVVELSARILEMERDGYKFNRDWVNGVAHNGRRWRIIRYSLK